MRRRRVAMPAFAAVVLMLLCSCAYRETGGEAVTGRAVIERSIESMGGLLAMTGWKTRSQQGVMEAEWPGWGHLTAATVRYVEKPDRAYIDNDFSAYDHPFYFTYYLDGDDAWQVVNLGVRRSEDLTGRMKEYVGRADGLAYYAAVCDTFTILGEFPGDSLLPGAAFVRVEGTAGEDTVLFDIDTGTGFLLRTIEAAQAHQTLFDNYRKAGDIMVPFHTTVFQDGAKTEEYHWESIRFDEPIDPAIFERERP
jgi:hypothetical protein